MPRSARPCYAFRSRRACTSPPPQASATSCSRYQRRGYDFGARQQLSIPLDSAAKYREDDAFRQQYDGDIAKPSSLGRSDQCATVDCPHIDEPRRWPSPAYVAGVRRPYMFLYTAAERCRRATFTPMSHCRRHSRHSSAHAAIRRRRHIGRHCWLAGRRSPPHSILTQPMASGVIALAASPRSGRVSLGRKEHRSMMEAFHEMVLLE